MIAYKNRVTGVNDVSVGSPLKTKIPFCFQGLRNATHILFVDYNSVDGGNAPIFAVWETGAVVSFNALVLCRSRNIIIKQQL